MEAQHKIIKKTPNQNENFLKKTMFRSSYLKSGKEPKISMGATRQS
jgi:hypothetical protein